jgi:predicted permease
VLFTIDPPRARYAGEARQALFEQIDRRIAAIPGVEASSLSETVLVSGGNSRTMVTIEGGAPGKPVATWVNAVGPRFFETMGLPIVRGRPYDARDRRESPRVAVVNQQFVRKYLPDGDPIGRRFASRNQTFEIVGVCGDTHFDRLRSSMPPTWFRLFSQADEVGAMTFEVRTPAAAPAILPLIRDAVRAVDKELPVFDVRTQRQQIDSTMAHERLFVTLTSAFGVLALVLACVGIHGILAQDVTRRTGEIGIRMALGATRGNVLVMVLREASLLTLSGVGVGVAAAAALGRHVQPMLYGVTATDPIAIGPAVAAMLAVALMAVWVPARRACRLDPMAALRHE